MLEVIRVLYTFHQHIIYIHLHGVPDKALEDLLYHPLEDGPCVLESEEHHLVATNSLTCSEGYLIFICWVHLDLITAGIGIHEAKELVSSLASTS